MWSHSKNIVSVVTGEAENIMNVRRELGTNIMNGWLDAPFFSRFSVWREGECIIEKVQYNGLHWQ